MTISIILLLIVAVVVMIRAYDLSIGQAAVCIILGFYLASSNFSGMIQHIITQLIVIISSISL